MHPPRISAIALTVPLISGCVIGVEMIGAEILSQVVQKAKGSSVQEEPRVVRLARYQGSEETNRTLKSYAGGRAALSSLAAPSAEKSDCRAIGPIPIENKLTIAQFIAKAVNDELGRAGLYDETSGAKWTGELGEVELSTNPLLESGWWRLAVKIRSDTGAEVSADVRHPFQVGTDAHKACEFLAPEALGAATRALVEALVSQAGFSSLLRR